MKLLHCISKILVLVGALNWGLIGFFHFNAVSMLLGGDFSTVTRIAYALVGLAAIFCLFSQCTKRCSCCGKTCDSNGNCGCSHKGGHNNHPHG